MSSCRGKSWFRGSKRIKQLKTERLQSALSSISQCAPSTREATRSFKGFLCRALRWGRPSWSFISSMCLLYPSPPCWNRLCAVSIFHLANWVNIQIPFIAIEGGCLNQMKMNIFVFFSNCTQVSLHLIINAGQQLFVECLIVSDESYEKWHSWLFYHAVDYTGFYC